MTSSKVEITDREGWRKEHALDKPIVHIGSDTRNDIVLDSAHGSGVSARHIQLISAAAGQGYRLINIGTGDIWVGPAAERNLPPRAFTDISAGEKVRVGEFTLVFQGAGLPQSVQTGGARASSLIGVDLALPDTYLHPDRPLEGSVIIRNLGDKTGVQFKLEVAGLEPDQYEMGPGPILFPNAEKEVFIRIQHPRRPKPKAGELRFSVRATAPAAYPGESATINKIIQVLPFYSQKVKLVIPDR